MSEFSPQVETKDMEVVTTRFASAIALAVGITAAKLFARVMKP